MRRAISGFSKAGLALVLIAGLPGAPSFAKSETKTNKPKPAAPVYAKLGRSNVKPRVNTPAITPKNDNKTPRKEMGKWDQLNRDSVENRYRAVMPFINGTSSLKATAAGATISESQLKLWHNALVNAGKTALITNSSPDMAEFIEKFNGTWELESRIAHGFQANVNAQMFFNLELSRDGNSASGTVLVMESGLLDAFVSDAGSEEMLNKPFSLGALFNVTAVYDNAVERISPTSNQASANAAKVPGGIIVTYDGELQGSYGTFREGVRTKASSPYVKQGESYTMFSPVETPSGNEGRNEEFDQIVQVGDTMIFKSTGLDLVDTYKRVSTSGALVSGTFAHSTFWDMLKRDGTLVRGPKGAPQPAAQQQ